MSLYQPFEVKKIEICNMQKNSGPEISNNLHHCVDPEILPQNKKKKSWKKESVWGRYHCLKIIAIIIFLESSLCLQKSNDSRFHLRCLILVKQKLIWGFFDLLNLMQISDLHQQASIFTCKKSLLLAWWPIFFRKIM